MKNASHFLTLVRETIFNRSQTFQRDHSNDFKKVLKCCSLDYLTIIQSFGVQKDSKEYNEIKKCWDKLHNILSSSYSGKRSTAYIQLKNLINDLFCSEIIYTHSSDTLLYRMRVCTLRKNISRKDIFHIPFNMIRGIKTQRYSTPGYPCLYLARSIYGCWEEMHRPSIESTLVSQFKSKENFNLLDLRIPDANRFSRAESFYLKFIPVVIACTIPVLDAEGIFKPEYTIPQFILEWTIEKGANNNIKGIIYTSAFSNSEFFSLDYEWENIAMPVQKMSGNEGYCPFLSKLFVLTRPTCYEYEVMLGNLRHLGFNDEDNWQYFEGARDRTAYMKSTFGLMENILQSKEKDLIYRDS